MRRSGQSSARSDPTSSICWAVGLKRDQSIERLLTIAERFRAVEAGRNIRWYTHSIDEKTDCQRLEAGSAEFVVLTLGEDGALLITPDAAYGARAPAPPVVSAVGAGDSFVGGMVWKLADSGSVVEAFRYGVAAGSAAVLNPGTELCHAADTARLYNEIEIDSA